MKSTKAAANYRKGSATRNCGTCKFMNSDGSCDKVQGQVTRGMVSKFYQPEKRARG